MAEAKLYDFHFHDCRHQFASRFVLRHGSLQALKALKTTLGHASPAITMRYAHVAREHLRSEVIKTERRAEPAEVSTQASTHERAELVGCLRSPYRCWLPGQGSNLRPSD